MNKNVFNYLSNKSHELTDYIKTKAEQAENYLSDHAKEIKRMAIKTTATALTAATLLGGMTGCTLNNQQGQNSTTPSTSISASTEKLRPREEIEQTGITAEDVLALYDEFARDAIRAFHGFPGNPIHIDILTGDFVFLSPQYVVDLETREKLSIPCYIKEDDFTPTHSWLTDSSHQLYNPNTQNVGEVYLMTLLVHQHGIGKEQDKHLKQFAIPAAEFEKLMSVFNNEQFIISSEYTQDKNELFELDNHIGKNAYNSIIFDKELITNANEEQLWALYNAMEAMYSINFYGELPNNNKDYTDLEIDSLI